MSIGFGTPVVDAHPHPTTGVKRIVLSPSYLADISASEIYPYLLGTSAFERDGYCYVPMPPYSSELVTKLQADGFFAFHPTNQKRELFTLHQIIAFYCCGGYKAHKRYGLVCRKDDHEIHHYDGNSLNNDPKNLIYLPSKYHRMITRLQQGMCRVVNAHTWAANDNVSWCWNRQGKLVKNLAVFIARVAALTLFKTSTWLNGRTFVKDIVNFVKKVAKALRSGFDLDSINPDDYFEYEPRPYFKFSWC